MAPGTRSPSPRLRGVKLDILAIPGLGPTLHSLLIMLPSFLDSDPGPTTDNFQLVLRRSDREHHAIPLLLLSGNRSLNLAGDPDF